ncbi:hypothetical protein E2C01_043768 [Portunus trituberculatus]|uniref:Uncharacterized protein n=1 Tax=Portunus trituberculatus TaxID=210409 RepID=A0A5B7FY77_PORTR|nr:hypothetical protein [Portunus trituberculatus]
MGEPELWAAEFPLACLPRTHQCSRCSVVASCSEWLPLGAVDVLFSSHILVKLPFRSNDLASPTGNRNIASKTLFLLII